MKGQTDKRLVYHSEKAIERESKEGKDNVGAKQLQTHLIRVALVRRLSEDSVPRAPWDELSAAFDELVLASDPPIVDLGGCAAQASARALALRLGGSPPCGFPQVDRQCPPLRPDRRPRHGIRHHRRPPCPAAPGVGAQAGLSNLREVCDYGVLVAQGVVRGGLAHDGGIEGLGRGAHDEGRAQRRHRPPCAGHRDVGRLLYGVSGCRFLSAARNLVEHGLLGVGRCSVLVQGSGWGMSGTTLASERDCVGLML